MIIFGGLRKGGHVAKGFIFEPPDLTTAAPAHLNEFQDQISLLLASLHEHQRLQVQWFCDSDYRAELLRYRHETERATNTWTRRCRNERIRRYWQAMLDRKLRRQKLVIYIARAIDTVPTPLQLGQFVALLPLVFLLIRRANGIRFVCRFYPKRNSRALHDAATNKAI